MRSDDHRDTLHRIRLLLATLEQERSVSEQQADELLAQISTEDDLTSYSYAELSRFYIAARTRSALADRVCSELAGILGDSRRRG